MGTVESRKAGQQVGAAASAEAAERVGVAALQGLRKMLECDISRWRALLSTSSRQRVSTKAFRSSLASLSPPSADNSFPREAPHLPNERAASAGGQDRGAHQLVVGSGSRIS